jgi:hypothetical protein
MSASLFEIVDGVLLLDGRAVGRLNPDLPIVIERDAIAAILDTAEEILDDANQDGFREGYGEAVADIIDAMESLGVTFPQGFGGWESETKIDWLARRAACQEKS